MLRQEKSQDIFSGSSNLGHCMFLFDSVSAPGLHYVAYPQADVDRPLYMKMPKGINTVQPAVPTNTCILQLIKSLYGQRKAGRVWHLWLTKRLLKMDFTESSIDPCIFYYKGTVMLVHVNDTILLGPTRTGVDEIIELFSSAFDIESESNTSDYLGVKVTKNNGTDTLTKPHFINSIYITWQ